MVGMAYMDGNGYKWWEAAYILSLLIWCDFRFSFCCRVVVANGIVWAG